MTAIIIDETYSDLHKDVYGFRPRSVPVYADQAEADADYARLVEELKVVMADEHREQLAARKIVKERLRKYMREFKIDAVTALQWDFDAFGADALYNWSEYCYQTDIGGWFNYRLLRSGIKPPLKFQQFRA